MYHAQCTVFITPHLTSLSQVSKRYSYATVKSQQVIVQLNCWVQCCGGQSEAVADGVLHCVPNMAEQCSTPNLGPV